MKTLSRCGIPCRAELNLNPEGILAELRACQSCHQRNSKRLWRRNRRCPWLRRKEIQEPARSGRGPKKNRQTVTNLEQEIKQLEAKLAFTDFAPRGGRPIAIVLIALGVVSPFLCVYIALRIGTPPYFGNQNSPKVTMLEIFLICLFPIGFLRAFFAEAIIHFKLSARRAKLKTEIAKSLQAPS
jgi:hypothetical protein